MNIGHDHDHDHDSAGAPGFDERLRQLHAQAIERVSPRTRAQLQPQRVASRPSPWIPMRAWPLAATCAIALIAGGLSLRHPTRPLATDDFSPGSVASPVSDNEAGDVYATLDESPDLYLWLASSDTANLVTE